MTPTETETEIKEVRELIDYLFKIKGTLHEAAMDLDVAGHFMIDVGKRFNGEVIEARGYQLLIKAQQIHELLKETP